MKDFNSKISDLRKEIIDEIEQKLKENNGIITLDTHTVIYTDSDALVVSEIRDNLIIFEDDSELSFFDVSIDDLNGIYEAL
jgi:hypothetical protein